MDYAALTTLIQATRSTQALTKDGTADQQIADLLNAKTISVNRAVKRSDFAIWAASTGMRATIQDHADNVASPLRSIALSLLDVLRGAAESIDFSLASNTSMLDAWVLAGALSVANKDSLLALSSTSVSLAEQSLGQTISAADVSHAWRE